MRFNNRKLRIVAISGVLIFLIFSNYPPIAALRAAVFGIDLTNPVHQGTSTIELVHEGHDRRSQRVLSIAYAMKAGFTEIYMGAEKYHRTSDGAAVYLRTPAPAQRPRYKVTETVVSPNYFNRSSWPDRGDIRIVVVDTHTNTEIGRWHGPGPGWAGDQAGHFATSVLKPRTASRLGEPRYPIGTSFITEPGTISIQQMPDARVARACPGKYDAITDGEQLAKQLTDDIHGAVNDLHMEVEFSHGLVPPDMKVGPPPATQAEWDAQNNLAMRAIVGVHRAVTNLGVDKVDHLSPNIGYLQISRFPPDFSWPKSTPPRWINSPTPTA
jgi:hypothetical protein